MVRRWRESLESRLVWQKSLRLGCSDFFYCIDASLMELTKYIRIAGSLLLCTLSFIYYRLHVLQFIILYYIISTINCIRRTNCWHMVDKSCFPRSELYTRKQFSACLEKITFHSNIFIQMYCITIKNITFATENCSEESVTEWTTCRLHGFH